MINRCVSLTHIIGHSPDEISFYRNQLIQENVSNSLVMIQPSLLSYTFSGEPTPVLLDLHSVKVSI